MKISKLETVLTNIDGEQYQDNGKPLTLKRTIITALATGVPSDAQAQAKDKEHCYDLFLEFKTSSGEKELDSEDAALIKNRIAQLYPPIIAGQAIKMIESKAANSQTEIK